MKRIKRFAVFTAVLAALGSYSAANASSVETGKTNTSVSQSDEQKKSWKGTASATCKCSNGVCLPVSCSVSGKATYEAAKNALKTAIEAKIKAEDGKLDGEITCLLYTSPSPRDRTRSRMPSSA